MSEGFGTGFGMSDGGIGGFEMQSKGADTKSADTKSAETKSAEDFAQNSSQGNDHLLKNHIFLSFMLECI